MNLDVKHVLTTGLGILFGALLIKYVINPKFINSIPSGDSPLDKGN